MFFNTNFVRLRDIEVESEKVDSVSLTVPDMSLTIKEILDNYTRGINVSSQIHNGTYDENPDFDNVPVFRQPSFDLSDISNASGDINDFTGPEEKEVLEPNKSLDSTPSVE